MACEVYNAASLSAQIYIYRPRQALNNLTPIERLKLLG